MFINVIDKADLDCGIVIYPSDGVEETSGVMRAFKCAKSSASKEDGLDVAFEESFG